jgi:hypothetical protein
MHSETPIRYNLSRDGRRNSAALGYCRYSNSLKNQKRSGARCKDAGIALRRCAAMRERDSCAGSASPSEVRNGADTVHSGYFYG